MTKTYPDPFNHDGYFRVKTHSEIPKTWHYAIIESDSVYIEGDERSRTNPGHGYPGYTNYYTTYIVFYNKETWEAYIKTNDRKKFVAVCTYPAEIKTEVKVSVNIPTNNQGLV
jgi:hypothetical protein